MEHRPRIVIPGDNPPLLQGTTHLERLRQYGDVVLYKDAPRSLEEQVIRTRGAEIVLATGSAFNWSGEVLRALPSILGRPLNWASPSATSPAKPRRLWRSTPWHSCLLRRGIWLSIQLTSEKAGGNALTACCSTARLWVSSAPATPENIWFD